MNNNLDLARYQLDPDRFISSEILYQNRHNSIERVLDSETKQSYIMHTFPYYAFETSSLLEFTKILFSNLKNQNLLSFYGMISTSTHFKILYIDPGVSNLDINQLDRNNRIELLKSISQAVSYLHSLNFPHLRIKQSSIFVKIDTQSNSNQYSFYFGCFTPLPIIDLDEEDRNLPFYNQPVLTRDIFMFGLFIYELMLEKNVNQTDLLNTIWKFESLPSSDPLLSLANKCINFDYLLRPNFKDISACFEQNDSNNPNETQINDELFQTAINTINSVHFLLLRGYLYSLKKDKENAIKVYQSELLRDHPIAINNTACIYSQEKTQDSFVRATELFKHAADLGCIVSQRNYAFALNSGKIPPNHEEELHYLQLSADEGFTDSLFGLFFVLFDRGDLAAIKYIRAAAIKTHPSAIHMYGLMIKNGLGFPGDTELNFYKMGVDNHYVQLMNNYATTTTDINVSNELWKQSANLGQKHGQYNYAVSLLLGRGVPMDKQEAALYMKKASDQQYVPAMLDYALMLREGIGVPKDETAAEELCSLAGSLKIRSHLTLEAMNKKIEILKEKTKL